MDTSSKHGLGSSVGGQSLNRRRFLRTSAIAGAGALLAACAPKTVSPSQTTQAIQLRPTLNVALSDLGDEALDPIMGTGLNLKYISLLFDPFIGMDYKGESISKETGIAKDWRISQDGKVFDFTIRSGVKFHNGDELTADDVKFSLGRLSAPDVVTSKAKDISDLIASVVVQGPYQIQIALKNLVPANFFLTGLVSEFVDNSCYIVPMKYFQSVGAAGFAKAPVGSGPYKFVDRQVGAVMNLEQAFPEHFAVGVPRFKRITLKPVPDNNTRLAMLKSGAADYIDIGLTDAPSVKQAGFRLFPKGKPDQCALFWQAQRPNEATRDINLRKALSYAINRAELNETLVAGVGSPSNLILSRALSSSVGAPTPYDVGMAKDFLSRAGYGPGVKNLTMQFQVFTRTGWPQLREIAQAIQSYWSKIGVDSKIIFGDYATFRAQWGAGTLPAPAVFLLTSAQSTYELSSAVNFYSARGKLATVSDPTLEDLLSRWKQANDDRSYDQAAGVVSDYIYQQFWNLPLLAAAQQSAGNDQIAADFSQGTDGSGFHGRAMVWGKR